MGYTMNFKPANFGRNAMATVAFALTMASAVHAQAYVNITVGGAFAPGVYGQISIGNNPPPPLLNVQPVIAGQALYGAPVMYLHVPLEESRDWGRYCSRYRACGHSVHFVRVDEGNRWWDQHNEYLRGEGYYGKPDDRRGERGNDRWGSRRNGNRDDPNDPRFESKRGER